MTTNNCSNCGVPLINEPMTQGVPGGDWFAACAVCEWHSEQDGGYTSIRKSLTPVEIVDIKLQVNAIRKHVYSLVPHSETLHILFMLLSASLLEQEEKV